MKRLVCKQIFSDANLFFNSADTYRNIKLFENGTNNILFVTGFSGSGKSTLSNELAKKYNAIGIELDTIYGWNKEIVTYKYWEKFCDLYLNKNAKDVSAILNDNYNNEHITIVLKFIQYIKNIFPTTKFIINGVQLIDCIIYGKQEEYYPVFHKCSIILKSTSALISLIRKMKRDKYKAEDFQEQFQYYIKDYKNYIDFTQTILQLV